MPTFFKNKRIAGYIRKGLELMKESPNDWFHFDGKTYMGCAAGLAIAGKLGAVEGHKAYLIGLNKNKSNVSQTISEILEVQPLLVTEISELHIVGVPALEIAECLEYENGLDVLDKRYSPQ